MCSLYWVNLLLTNLPFVGFFLTEKKLPQMATTSHLWAFLIITSTSICTLDTITPVWCISLKYCGIHLSLYKILVKERLRCAWLYDVAGICYGKWLWNGIMKIQRFKLQKDFLHRGERWANNLNLPPEWRLLPFVQFKILVSNLLM